MGDVYRESRVYRERERGGESSSDDEQRIKSTTVRRYKVTPSRVDRYDRSDRDTEFDDRRSRFSNAGRTSGDLFESDRRSTYAPDRPRSAFDAYGGDRSRASFYERDVVERDQPQRDARSYVYEKEVEREREPYRDPDRGRIAVYETKEVERDWDHRFDEDDVKYEKRIERRRDGDYQVEKRVEEHVNDPHDCEVERYRKETEIYSPVEPPLMPAPVIIRQRAPEPQKIIVQEAPPPPPVIVPRQDPGIIVIREREREQEDQKRQMVRREPQEEEYYYRHERRDIGGYRGDRNYAVEKYDRRRRDHDHHSDDEDYYVRRTVVRRRERSESPHHKRHIAEGALAGAGITALLNSRRNEYGDLPENRGRKVIAGAALGALGSEALRRAHSAYEDRWRDEEESPDRHSRLKKGLGIAAVALAAAGATKYYQSNKVEKEEAHRGRSRRRDSYEYRHTIYSRSRSNSGGRSRSKSKSKSSRRRSLSTAAKAAIGTAATAGLVKHLRKKSKEAKSRSGSSSSRSRSRSRSRSKSKLRRGAELAGAAAAAGIAGKMWKNHKDKKKDDKSDYSSSDDEHHRRRGSPSRSRSRSRSRSNARSIRSERGTDPELGLVEYGTDPLPTDPPASRGYESEAEERRRRRRRRRDRDRSRSSSASDHERKRSKSRLRDMAAAGAAAIGIKEYKDKKDREKREQRSREREHDRDRDRDRERERERDRDHRPSDRSRSRDHDRRTYDDDPMDDRYFDNRRPHSPPTASGGAYYPPYPTGPPPANGGFTQYPNHSGEFQPYVPQDYTGYPPPPPGPPPGGPPQASGAVGGFPPPPPGPPPPGPPGPPPPGPPPTGGRYPPDHVSDTVRSSFISGQEEDGINSEVSHAPKSVAFIPLSPKSSMTMKRHRQEHVEAVLESEEEKEKERDTAGQEGFDLEHALTRFISNSSNRRSTSSSSDPSHESAVRRRKRHSYDSDSSSDETEVLPDRFDSRGRPLDGQSASPRRWNSRRGDFEYRPKHNGDWNVKGAWQVGGTDQEMIEKIVRNVTGVLEGRQNWLGMLGSVLGEIQDGGRRRTIEDDGGRQRKYRKRH